MRLVHMKSRVIVCGLFIFVIVISNYARIHSNLHRLKNVIVPIKKDGLAQFYNRKARAYPVWKYQRRASEKDLQTELEKRLELASDEKVSVFSTGYVPTDKLT